MTSAPDERPLDDVVADLVDYPPAAHCFACGHRLAPRDPTPYCSACAPAPAPQLDNLPNLRRD